MKLSFAYLSAILVSSLVQGRINDGMKTEGEETAKLHDEPHFMELTDEEYDDETHGYYSGKNEFMSGSSVEASEKMQPLYTSPERTIADRWIVKIKTPEGGSRLSASNRNVNGDSVFSATQMSSLAATYNADVTNTFVNSFHGFSAIMTENDAISMAQDPNIEFIEQDATISLDAVESWGLDRVDQRSLPLDNSYSTSYINGTGVTAYIIDTGIRSTHNDFGGRAVHGTNTVGDGQNNDCNGHGTHVAGTVGGTLYGIAKNVQLIGVKVLDCNGNGSYTSVIQGIEWAMNDAISNGKTATANLSLGGGASASIDEAVRNLHNAGIPTVVAAGNKNTNACNQSPAREPAVITVGSTTSSDARSSFSNWGTCVDIFAPGSSISSAWINNDDSVNTISGTSMAAPHVCGVAALMLSSGIRGPDVKMLLDGYSTLDAISNAGTGSPNKLLFLAHIPNPSTLTYGSKIILRVNNLDNRWLTGGRGGGNAGVATRNYFDGGYEQSNGHAYEWIVRSSPGNGIRSDQDPNQGSCVKFGDNIYLQVNNRDNRWLTGGRGGGNAGVYTRDTPDWSYEWTVRSDPGNGERSYPDPLDGNCLQEGNQIFLQVNNLDNRWLTGGRGGYNQGVSTKNHLDGGYEEGNKHAFVWTVTRDF